MSDIQNNGSDAKKAEDQKAEGRLAADLDELGQSYQQVATDEPPDMLDQAILNKAHRAVEKGDRWMDFGWVHGLTTAAVVVLGLSIVLTLRQPSGLDETGITPVDVSSTGRSRAAKTAPLGELKKEQVHEAEQRKDVSDDQHEPLRESISAFKSVDSRAEPPSPATATLQDRDVNLLKIAAPSGSTIIEGDLTPLSSPEESALFRQDAFSGSNEPTLETEDNLEMDAGVARIIADKTDLERLSEKSAEQQMKAILLLKQAGDERWRSDLEAFVLQFPDYPLPDEMHN